MELYLQFGYGMMTHSCHLISEWGGGTAILSPRDLQVDQMTRLAKRITGLPDGHVMLDPQFYLPHADHKRLCSHAYWPADYETTAFWQGSSLERLLVELTSLNDTLSTSAFILPGVLADQINDDWLETQRAVSEAAKSGVSGRPLLTTIALSADAAKNQEQIALLLETAPMWPTSGYYLVCEHPNGEYLVSDPNWLANVLDLVAGLRSTTKPVIVGYCNHQMLIAAVAKPTAICSGTWMNVRSFPPDKFRAAYDDEIRQRATWYYCPQALSEYKVPYLDIAQRQNVLDDLAPLPEIDGGYVANLFAGAQPSAVGFAEQPAFRHYLHCLHCQVQAVEMNTYDRTVAYHERLLDTAETLLKRLATAGVRGQMRDFTDSLDVNRAALAVFQSTRGPLLRRRWATP
jgi:hypothetical protein